MFVVVAGDELLSDSFPYKEIQNGILWEVEGKVRLSSPRLTVGMLYCFSRCTSC
jgi:hypothetical protein